MFCGICFQLLFLEGYNAGSSISTHVEEKYGDAGGEKEKAKMEHRSPQYELE